MLEHQRFSICSKKYTKINCRNSMNTVYGLTNYNAKLPTHTTMPEIRYQKYSLLVNCNRVYIPTPDIKRTLSHTLF